MLHHALCEKLAYTPEDEGLRVLSTPFAVSVLFLDGVESPTSWCSNLPGLVKTKQGS